MMKNLVYSLFLILAIEAVFVFKGASAKEAFQCYVCNSVNDTDCETLTPGKYIKNCSEVSLYYPDPNSKATSTPICRKIVQAVDKDYPGGLKAHERIIRTCGYEEPDREKYYRAGFGGRMAVYACGQSLCNSAIAVSASLSAVVASIVSIVAARLF